MLYFLYLCPLACRATLVVMIYCVGTVCTRTASSLLLLDSEALAADAARQAPWTARCARPNTILRQGWMNPSK